MSLIGKYPDECPSVNRIRNAISFISSFDLILNISMIVNI